MMYSEFIERTGFTETYITYGDYATYIEPIYMNGAETAIAFCNRFYKLYRERVANVVSMLISAIPTEEKELFICGESNVMADVKGTDAVLKSAFLKTWNKNYI